MRSLFLSVKSNNVKKNLKLWSKNKSINRIKSEKRNSKFETISKTINSNVQNFLNFCHLIFGFVSTHLIKSGDIRISNFLEADLGL